MAKAYTRMAVRFIDTLITMGTPQRGDFQAYPGTVGNYFNLYSKYDVVQRVGGPWYWPFSGRTDRCAINIGIDRAPKVGKVSDGDLHTAEVWGEMEKWLVRAGYGLNPVGVNGGCPGWSVPNTYSSFALQAFESEEALVP